eukprot:TRINITY_DN3063_c0_g2_i1.p1 TRINITY_DN3063_c0_g2~~TRINITY_DN3063_c0_g2_i1.p1  ORF type:complete len:184 (+),score=70.98 TRINITY_DN3063_c0_g2_i1:101-652(+)
MSSADVVQASSSSSSSNAQTQRSPLVTSTSNADQASSTPNEDDATLILTNALLETFQPTLKQITAQLGEIQLSQQALSAKINAETTKFLLDTESIRRINQVFARVPEYDVKTQKVVKEMNSINDRINKLKKNTERLKARKQKDDADEAKRLQKQMEKEKQLLALPASDIDSQQKKQQQSQPPQ